jgi:hypothetical protein
MLLDIRYTDDGFIADALLTVPEERHLTDREVARQLWRPDQILWVVPPIVARVRTEGLARIPVQQKWTVMRRRGVGLFAEAMMTRLRAKNVPPQVTTAAPLDTSAWVHARVCFFGT